MSRPIGPFVAGYRERDATHVRPWVESVPDSLDSLHLSARVASRTAGSDSVGTDGAQLLMIT